jgi:uncharacterized protein (DUF302 family)
MTATDDTGASGQVTGVTSRVSPWPFEATVNRLLGAMEERGVRVFDAIDHRAAAVEAGLELRPTRVIVFGSPAAGTPMMVASPLLALELPMRILVWEADDGRVRLDHLTAEALAGQFHLDPALAGPLGAPDAIIAAALAEK